jgi:hypothetical protein
VLIAKFDKSIRAQIREGFPQFNAVESEGAYYEEQSGLVRPRFQAFGSGWGSIGGTRNRWEKHARYLKFFVGSLRPVDPMTPGNLISVTGRAIKRFNRDRGMVSGESWLRTKTVERLSFGLNLVWSGCSDRRR